MIQQLLPSLILGLFVILIGSGFLLSHIWHYRQNANESNEKSTKQEDMHLKRRYRRRMKGSSLLVLIGFTIPILDYMVTFAPQKITAVVTLLLLLLLVVVLLMISMGDLVATNNYRRAIYAKLKEIEQRKATLQTEIDVLRFRQGDPEVRALSQGGTQGSQHPSDQGDSDYPPRQEKLF